VADRWASLAARAPVTVVFAALGLSAGTWAARIPAIKAELHLSLLIGQVWSGLVGFALLGIGLAVVVPLVFTAAAQTGRAGPNLALVTMTGYVGVLAGPALVGGVAQAIGLHAALGIDVILCAMCAALAGFVRPRPPGQG
jgi:MFS family permease